ncbi:MAG: GDP-L-fucose synthase [Patescibacteria group bacterium]
MDLKDKKILITGGGGFLGSHVIQKLLEKGVPQENIFVPRQSEYDLRKLEDCKKAVSNQQIVIHLAAKVGGIGFNQEKPGELFYDNMVMGAQMIEAAYRAGVQKFVALGTVCAYPKFTSTPFKEENLWNDYPEETNAHYGLAKKALLIQAQAYRSQYGFNVIFLLPVNLYGSGDSFDPTRSHVIPALIKKVADAIKNKEDYINVWGTGQATREFLYAPDAAEGIVLATEKYDKSDPVNLGSGQEISIKNLIALICRLMGFKGEIRWDISKPDGQPRRMLDTSRAEQEFDFKAKTSFVEGLKKTIKWYLQNQEESSG